VLEPVTEAEAVPLAVAEDETEQVLVAVLVLVVVVEGDEVLLEGDEVLLTDEVTDGETPKVSDTVAEADTELEAVALTLVVGRKAYRLPSNDPA